ncbi:hypothetical protein MMC10_000712 [Thelotrema lepadinum]|nr:hypothetical protein [Thelotrema lepadinum]
MSSSQGPPPEKTGCPESDLVNGLQRLAIASYNTDPSDQVLSTGLQQLALETQATLAGPPHYNSEKDDGLVADHEALVGDGKNNHPQLAKTPPKQDKLNAIVKELILLLHDSNWTVGTIAWICNRTKSLDVPVTEEEVSAYILSEELQPHVGAPVQKVDRMLEAFANMELDDDRNQPNPTPVCPDYFRRNPTAGGIIEDHQKLFGYDTAMNQSLLEREGYGWVSLEDIKDYLLSKGITPYIFDYTTHRTVSG